MAESRWPGGIAIPEPSPLPSKGEGSGVGSIRESDRSVNHPPCIRPMRRPVAIRPLSRRAVSAGSRPSRRRSRFRRPARSARGGRTGSTRAGGRWPSGLRPWSFPFDCGSRECGRDRAFRDEVIVPLVARPGAGLLDRLGHGEILPEVGHLGPDEHARALAGVILAGRRERHPLGGDPPPDEVGGRVRGGSVAEQAVPEVVDLDQRPGVGDGLAVADLGPRAAPGSGSSSRSTRAGIASRSSRATRASAAWSATGAQG